MKSIFRCTAGPLIGVCAIFLLAACPTGPDDGTDPEDCESDIFVMDEATGVYNCPCPVGDGQKDDFCKTDSDCVSNRCCTSEAVCTDKRCTCRNALSVVVNIINTDQQVGLLVRLTIDQETFSQVVPHTTDAGVPAADIDLTLTAGSAVEVESFVDGVLQAKNKCLVDAATVAGGFAVINVARDVILCGSGFANADE